MYAIGVFTGFTMAGAGMVAHHWRHRDQHWRQRVVVNGFAAVVCAVVVVVFAVAGVHPGGLGRRRGDAAPRLRPGHR